MAVALIMAGGASARMRAGGSAAHKALVRVLGVPLVERNLLALLAAGVRDIVVAMNAKEAALQHYVHGRARRLASARGARVESLIESESLGTIGAAGLLASRREAVLVVNVDNLTALSVNGLVNAHAESGASLTIATHYETFRLPFGEVVLNDGRVELYSEKPVLRINVSSGMYVLSPDSCRAIEAGRRTDVPDFVRLQTARGCAVRAFPHQAPWIDINDGSLVAAAEQLVAEHPDQFECWDTTPDRCCDDVLLMDDDSQVFVAFDSSTLEWKLPPLDAFVDGNGSAGVLEPLAVFDDLDPSSGELRRHEVRVGRVVGAKPDATCSGSQWIGLDAFESLNASSSLRRSLAWLRRRM